MIPTPWLRVLLACLVLALPQVAEAGEMGLRLARPVVHDEAAPTVIRPTLTGGVVDFGQVANLGPQPANGRRIDLPDADAQYVATIEIEVVDLEPTRSRRDPKARRIRRVPAFDPGDPITPTPPGFASANRGQRGALYALLTEGAPDTVSLGPTDDPESRPIREHLLGSTPTLLAGGLSPGDRLTFRLAMRVDAAETGPRLANVRFVLR